MSQKNFMLSLFTQVYESVTSKILLEVTLGWTSIPSREGGGGGEKRSVASCYRKQVKLHHVGFLGSCAT